MTMLMRFDPLREFDRVFDQAWSQTRQASVPMDAYRHGDSFVIHLDLPGVQALLDTLSRTSFRRELESLGGYDTREAGERIL